MTRSEHSLPSSVQALKHARFTLPERQPRTAPEDRFVFASRSRMPDSAEAMRPDLPRAGGILTSAQMQGVRE